ncbi:ComEC/Rec2 family competence protein [Ammoniphilus sp. CFH 90114]|uniref:ComEC/Rec2 family competence protein n=1 Tax=Ammoniphilus sp. CFH 90114 TaxID=2493665 RepID=UPI00100DA529|nr:MBL fold metallo-hydrolase [Ammoniphilus sp. CFH 90114]RXT13949.1 MBL fold metallo-hydrolase [Ammoniphilus sp. CFH 90114]
MNKLLTVISLLFFLFSGEGNATDRSPHPPLPDEQDFEGIAVHYLAVSEGEASLIKGTDGFTMLIDTGSMKSGSEVADLLEQHQVKKIDVLILTGGMNDHIGGTNEILERFPVSQVLVPALIQDTILTKIHVPIRKLTAIEEGQTYEWPMSLKMRVLHPTEPLSLSPQANSLVFQLIHNQVKFLFTSDINEDAENELLEKYNVKSQILKVSDSGSNQASSPPFLEKVDAHAAIIFRNKSGAEGFDEVIERLNETWIDIYQTRTHGTISVFSNGEDYRIDREKTKGYFDAK